jgi:hypothetical protein
LLKNEENWQTFEKKNKNFETKEKKRKNAACYFIMPWNQFETRLIN